MGVDVSDLIVIELTGRVGIKKNSRTISTVRGKPVSRVSAPYARWVASVAPELHNQKIALMKAGVQLPLKGYLVLTADFYLANRQHEPDLSNMLEGPQDLFQAQGIIENDRQIVAIRCRKFVGDGVDRAVFTIGPARDI